MAVTSPHTVLVQVRVVGDDISIARIPKFRIIRREIWRWVIERGIVERRILVFRKVQLDVGIGRYVFEPRRGLHGWSSYGQKRRAVRWSVFGIYEDHGGVKRVVEAADSHSHSTAFRTHVVQEDCRF